ncbi:carboxylesterase family protein [Levilactobacillus fujinensis]|uniref:Alpha/beta hydrolase-fold protein n=1 Tax=Levilactobacillus fujinensis TaxID=2486024 RepID=A0ABW1TEN7_9LACO|nr:alpha/beta hydrolase-fold protein [Levilactobacillus fujinensis]
MHHFRRFGLLLAAIVLTGTLVACGKSSTKNATSSSATSSSASSTSTKSDTNDAATTPSLKSVLKQVESKYIQLTYTDPKTGVKLAYNLYVPDNYNKNKSYPLITFIHDDSIVGKSTKSALTQGYGGVIWATKAEQKKHASFVLVPAFKKSTVAGGMGQSGSSVVKSQVNTYLDLLASLQKKYSIDNKRLYATGQSMGCMTMLYLNATHPNLFAASLYVSGQWDVSQLKALRKQKFFYIVAGGDSQATSGQTSLITSFKKNSISYTNATWNATWSTKKLNTAANKSISQNKDRNFVTWTKGSVLTGSSQTMEHMASFDHGYTVPAVRDWLFNQSK